MLRKTAQSILLYQRLTQVIAKLVDGVELELQTRMDNLDAYVRRTAENLEHLNPEVDRLKGGLEDLQDYLAKELGQTMKRSTESMHEALRNAGDLQQVLSVFLKTVLDSQSQIASAHEQSLQHVTTRADDEMTSLMAVVGAAAASSVALQQQMVDDASLYRFSVPLISGIGSFKTSGARVSTQTEYVGGRNEPPSRCDRRSYFEI
jgi:chromosome segregation ATPase